MPLAALRFLHYYSPGCHAAAAFISRRRAPYFRRLFRCRWLPFSLSFRQADCQLPDIAAAAIDIAGRYFH
jgi:hypothetical protein